MTMMTRRATLLAAVALLAGAGRGLIHGGHQHKAMGTVAALGQDQIDVKTTDGKQLSFVVTDATKYLKGKSPAPAADLKVGDRVVVSYVEEGQKKTAREVRFSTAAAKP
jgi:membrane-associated protease RseP (regulator of RpoE activity)